MSEALSKMNVTFYLNPDNSMTNPGLPTGTAGTSSVDNIQLALAILAARGTAG